MLTDPWAIALLVGILLLTVVYGIGFRYAVDIIRYWNPEKYDERQTQLERTTYLLSALIKIGVGLNLLILILFFFLTNNHFPSVIQGAMCADGVLQSSEWGFAAMYLLLILAVLGGFFAVMDSLDQAETQLPFTPSKYLLVFPLVLVGLGGLASSVGFLQSLDPDIITTCCSVSFQPKGAGAALLSSAQLVDASFWIFITSFGISVILIFLFYKTSIVGVIIYIINYLFILKNFFVKYIYGLSSHFCIYDLFLSHYYFIGFFIFGVLYFLLLYVFGLMLIRRGSIRREDGRGLLMRWRVGALLLLCISFSIPIFYWLSWDGDF